MSKKKVWIEQIDATIVLTCILVPNKIWSTDKTSQNLYKVEFVVSNEKTVDIGERIPHQASLDTAKKALNQKRPGTSVFFPAVQFLPFNFDVSIFLSMLHVDLGFDWTSYWWLCRFLELQKILCHWVQLSCRSIGWSRSPFTQLHALRKHVSNSHMKPQINPCRNKKQREIIIVG